MVTVATWNVNSVKARLLHLTDWLKRDKPGIVLLQELKCLEDAFPRMEIEELGYNLALYGEKSYNGVAILSKFPLSDVIRGLPGDESDTQARYIEAVVALPKAAMRVASVYVPNGQTLDSDKFQYKLRFMDRLHAHLQTLLAYDEMLVVGGDYNIAPENIDVHNPQTWEDSVLTHDEVRKRFRKILHLGLYDAMRLIYPSPHRGEVGPSPRRSGFGRAGGRGALYGLSSDKCPHPNPPPMGEGIYTWWDYRAGGFERDDGLRIDHLLLSPQAADRLVSSAVEKSLRALEKASDHAPVLCEIETNTSD